LFHLSADHPYAHSFPTRRSSDLLRIEERKLTVEVNSAVRARAFRALIAKLPLNARYRRTRRQPLKTALSPGPAGKGGLERLPARSEEHTSELQSRGHLVCRLLLE